MVNDTIDQLKILHFIYFEQYQLNIYSMLGHINCHGMVLAKMTKSFVYKRQNVYKIFVGKIERKHYDDFLFHVQ